MKGLKLLFCVSSCLNEWFNVSNLQNQSVTDRQTDRTATTTTLSRMRAEDK